MRDTSEQILTTEIVWKKGDFGYLLNFFAEEHIYQKYEADFFGLLHAIEYIEQ